MRILPSSRTTQRRARTTRRGGTRFRAGMVRAFLWVGLAFVILAAAAIWYRLEGFRLLEPVYGRLSLKSRNAEDALPVLRLDIERQDYERLDAQAEEALRTGYARREDAASIAARVQFQGQTLSAALWVQEGPVEQWQERRWSLEVALQEGPASLDAGVLSGMRAFSLQPMEADRFLNEWLYAQDLQNAGILTARSVPVHLSVNGQGWGPYVVRDLYTEEWLASQGRSPGAIVRLDDRLLWERRAQLAGGGAQDQDVSVDPIANTFELSAFARVVVDLSPDGEHTAAALGSLRAFQERQLGASQVFDPELLGRYVAHANLWGARQGLMWYNARYYYNPQTSLLEPIAHDAQPFTPQVGAVIDLAQYDDVAVMEAYAREAKRISQSGYLESFRAAYATESERIDALLALSGGTLSALWDRLEERQALLSASLHPPQTVYAYEEGRASGAAMVLRVGNLLRYPVVLQRLQAGEVRVDVRPEWIAGPAESVHPEATSSVVLRRVQGDVPRYVSLRVPPEVTDQLRPPMATSDAPPLQIVTRLVGLQEQVIVDVQPGDLFSLAPVLDRMLGSPGPPSIQEALDRHPYLVPGERPGVLKVQAGTWQVQGDLVLPLGVGLEATQPVTLAFGQESMLFATGPLRLHGPDEGGIHLVPQGDRWAGLIVYRAGPQAPSSLRNVEIRAAGGADLGGGIRTAGVIFYESPVLLDRCRVVDSTAEGAVHLVRARFEVARTEFGAVSGDALAVEQAQGRIEGCAFHDVLGNGIDAANSQVDVQDSTFLRVYDQAVSAGLGSKAVVQDVRVADAGVAIAGRDLSHVQVRDLDLGRVWMAGLAAYRHELAVGSAQIEATRVVSEGNVSILALAQPDHAITVDGVEVGASGLDVPTLHWRGANTAGVRVLSYRFGENIRLLGYNLDASAVESGGPVRLTLYWQGLAEIDQEYTVFVHLLDASEQFVTQWDAMPRDNAFPTTYWLPGRVIDDPHILALPQDIAPGRYQVAVGLYDWVTGERLPIQRLDGRALPDGVLWIEPQIEIG